jgi:hypothetical protein
MARLLRAPEAAEPFEPVLQRVIDAPPREGPPARDTLVQLEGEASPSKQFAQVLAALGDGIGRACIQVGRDLVLDEDAFHPLAELETEHLRDAPPLSAPDRAPDC